MECMNLLQNPPDVRHLARRKGVDQEEAVDREEEEAVHPVEPVDQEEAVDREEHPVHPEEAVVVVFVFAPRRNYFGRSDFCSDL